MRSEDVERELDAAVDAAVESLPEWEPPAGFARRVVAVALDEVPRPTWRDRLMDILSPDVVAATTFAMIAAVCLSLAANVIVAAMPAGPVVSAPASSSDR